MPPRVTSRIFLIALIGITVSTAEAQNILRIPKRGEKPEPTLLQTPKKESRPEPEPDNEKHLITILYETFCPDSERFMAQLGPVYDSLKDFLKVEFVPFGLTKLFCRKIINGKCQHPTFTCKHGPNSCLANRQHDCALQYSESQEKQMSFIMCTMGENKASVEKCLKLLGFSQYDFDTCMVFGEGTELQLKSYEKTFRWNLEKLPVILLDNEYFTEYQKTAKEDFRGFICGVLLKKYRNLDGKNLPTICRTYEQ